MSLILALLLAPLLPGIINRVKATFAGRQGQPVTQLYWELARLLRKGVVISPTTSPVFLLGPAGGLACMLLAALLVPMGMEPTLAFSGDLLVLVGLLALMRFLTVLAALDTGSAFEGMGASREVTFSVINELGLLLILAVAARQSHSLSLYGLWKARDLALWGSAGPVMALLLVSIFLLILAENARLPVDDPNTHLELTMIHEVMVLDHSGPPLALILYGSALKLWITSALLVDLVLPMHTGAVALDVAASLGCMAGVALAIGLVESTAARLSLTRVPHFLTLSSALAVLGMMLLTR